MKKRFCRMIISRFPVVKVGGIGEMSKRVEEWDRRSVGDELGIDGDLESHVDKSVMKRIQALTYPESGRIALGLSALAINSATNLSFPWIMGHAIDIVSAETAECG